MGRIFPGQTPGKLQNSFGRTARVFLAHCLCASHAPLALPARHSHTLNASENDQVTTHR